MADPVFVNGTGKLVQNNPLLPTITLSVTAGDDVFLSFESASGDIEPTSVTDGAGNTFTELTSFVSSGGNTIIVYRSHITVTQAGDVITLHMDGTGENIIICVVQYSGVTSIGAIAKAEKSASKSFTLAEAIGASSIYLMAAAAWGNFGTISVTTGNLRASGDSLSPTGNPVSGGLGDNSTGTMTWADTVIENWDGIGIELVGGVASIFINQGGEDAIG